MTTGSNASREVSCKTAGLDHERKRVYILADSTDHASDRLSLSHRSVFLSMSSSAPESPSAQYSADFRLGGSEKLRKPRWKLENLPDLTGKVVMITNPNNKVGKDVAKVPALCPVPTNPPDHGTEQALLQHGATVYIASSNISKAEQTITELKRETSKYPIFLHLDLGDRGNCQSAAQLFLG